MCKHRLRVKLVLRAAAVAVCLAQSCPGQRSAWSLSGELTTGYASNHAVDGKDLRNYVTPFTLDLDLDGYVGHQDFLSFTVRPQFLAGGSAPQAGFGGKNGLAANIQLLRRRAFPLTISYSNYHLDSLSYGALLGLDASRYRTRYEDWSLNWQLHFRRLPRVTLTYVRSNSHVRPELTLLPVQKVRDKVYGAQFDYVRWGWGFQGEWKHSGRSSDSIAPLVPSLTSLSADQDSNWAYFNAQRRFSGRHLFSLSAGCRSTDELLNHLLPLHHNGFYANLFTSLAGRSRWSALFQAAYNSDRNGIYRQGPLPVTPGAGTAIFSSGISTFTASSDGRYEMHPNWTLFGGLHWIQARNKANLDPRFTGSSLASNTGLGFHRKFSWAQVTSSYAFSLTRPLTAQRAPDNRATGHAVTIQAERGTLEKLELTGVVSAVFNRTTTDIFLEKKDLLAECGLGRRVGKYIFRGKIGYRTAEVQDFSRFTYHDWSFQIGAEHRLFKARYFQNAIGGTSVTLGTQIGLPGAPGGPWPSNVLLRRFLSASRSQGVTVNVSPWRTLHGQISWAMLGQNLDSRVQNRSHYFDSSLGYTFRLLALDVGYASYDQDLIGIAGVARTSFYVRVKRAFRVF